ncbi:MAG TPA: M56 family metallopeptidase [Edaphobacter sp.]|nr:M56 family metallopeptidase [Edaphobacter sp.]
MTFPFDWNEAWTAAIFHHLWQSTIFCLLLWVLALMLRRNSAQMRFRLWMLASVKFLLPFALLIAAGEAVSVKRAETKAEPFFSVVMEGPTAQSITSTKRLPSVAPGHLAVTSVAASPKKHRSIIWMMFGLWSLGCIAISGIWFVRWARLRAVAQRGESLPDIDGLRVVMTSGGTEPGIFGIFRPILILPQGLTDNLTDAQLKAIVEHELCHVRRRDNLTAAIHMFVSVVFWFHPLVWLIGRQLMTEREAACDEAVLKNAHSAFAYAEGILNVCKFYLEVPVACVSGVTGADLKKRIANILSGPVVHRLDLVRKVVLSVAGILSIGVPVAFGVLHAERSYAQAPAKQNIDDTWQGALHLQKDLRLVLKITKAPDGSLKSNFYSIDQNPRPLAVKETLFQGGELKLNVEEIDGTYKGKMSPDGTTITGDWKQGDQSHPLILVRATPETAWTIPEPPAKIPPMAADANPSFEVATIKPSDPNSKGKGFGGPPRHFQTHNTTLNDLIMFIYGVNTKQIIGAPSWSETDKFDITTGQPDVPGSPNQEQVKIMMRKLLETRFGLKFHKDKKELSAYVLGVAKDGPKLTKSTGDPNNPPAFFFTKFGHLTVRNATMDDFANGMQGAVFDRPVVNHTGLEGRWDCTLKWTPDDTQFQVFGAKIVPDESADAPPPVFTAIQEQIGLKLDAAKTMVDVMVLDHVEKPSEN